MTPTDHIESTNVQLLDVARVQPGYLSRGRVKSAADGSHRLLQAKDVSEDGGVRLDEAACFQPERKPELYQVSRGDILVVARGQDHRAHHVDQDLSNALAAATFYIVRVTTERIQPGYLAWWLNMPGVQAEIEANSRGTSIRYIGRETLENLRVPVPALDVQRRIERVASLWRQKKLLHSRIDQKREQYIQAVCQQAVRQAKE